MTTEFLDLDGRDLAVRDRYKMLVHAVGPRPIALVGTISARGQVNLAPFSFFGALGANPATIMISPTQRGADASSKDTLCNLRETREFSVSSVSWAMVERMNLASAEYPPGIDEFTKSGFGVLEGLEIAPPGVLEAPMVMECRVRDVIELGGMNASGNLVIGEVVVFRVRRAVLDEHGQPSPEAMDLVGRLGGDWYTRVRAGLFELRKPAGVPLGYDRIPSWVSMSESLSAKHLSQLAMATNVDLSISESLVVGGDRDQALQRVRSALEAGDVQVAWMEIVRCGVSAG